MLFMLDDYSYLTQTSAELMHIWVTDPKRKFLMDNLPQFEAAKTARMTTRWLNRFERDFLTKFPVAVENTGNEAGEVLRTKRVSCLSRICHTGTDLLV